MTRVLTLRAARLAANLPLFSAASTIGRTESRNESALAYFFVSSRPALAEQFPAVSRWVRERGRIEVGRHKDAGFVVRAMDDGVPVFEDDGSSTLAEALAALEDGLAE